MQSRSKQFQLRVNGISHKVTCAPSAPLLFVLRNDLGLMGTRQGCTTGHCGACTAQQDGVAVQTCTLPVSAASGELITIEGLGTSNHPHPLQQMFINHQAAQCGYCINGILMAVDAISRNFPAPDLVQLQKMLSKHLCRCGSHRRILTAIHKMLRPSGEDIKSP